MPTEEQAAWVARVLDVTIGMAAWTAAREQALSQLTLLDQAVARSGMYDKDRALVLLRAIRSNLPYLPTTAAEVDDVRYYLQNDDVIAAAETPNVFGVTVALRAPLLDALGRIRPRR